jgi:hypothetical protein
MVANQAKAFEGIRSEAWSQRRQDRFRLSRLFPSCDGRFDCGTMRSYPETGLSAGPEPEQVTHPL